MRWIDAVQQALTQLGGEGHLSEIYKIVFNLRTSRNAPTGELEAWVRYTLQQNSRGRHADIFDSVYPIKERKGVWRLK